MTLLLLLLLPTIWLAVATFMELPVSSQLSIRSALFGTMLITKKDKTIKFHFRAIGQVFAEWALAPFLACVAALCFFGVLKITILRSENAEKKIIVALPFVYGLSTGLLCLFVLYQVLPDIILIKQWQAVVAVLVAASIAAILSLFAVVSPSRRKIKISNKMIKKADLPKKGMTSTRNDEHQDQFENALKEYREMRVLHTVYEGEEEEKSNDGGLSPPTMSSDSGKPLKQLLASTPNKLLRCDDPEDIHNLSKTQTCSNSLANFKSRIFSIQGAEYDQNTLVRHALAEKFDEKMEDLFSFPQVLAACIFALAQSANEIATVMAPFGAILAIYGHKAEFLGNVEMGDVTIALWIRLLGGVGAALGFFLCGLKLSRCLGSKLTYLSNTRGFSAQICAVIIIIVMTQCNLPLSSTHALVGSILGVGIADNYKNVNWKLLLRFIGGWIGTLFICCGLASAIFAFTIYSPAYVVP
ncbi:hypothetical protein AMTRI_Chr01g109980 [Amborella trichopoda]